MQKLRKENVELKRKIREGVSQEEKKQLEVLIERNEGQIENIKELLIGLKKEIGPMAVAKVEVNQ